jgi:hypothetical protein
MYLSLREIDSKRPFNLEGNVTSGGQGTSGVATVSPSLVVLPPYLARQGAKRLEHLSAVSQCCGRSASLMTYFAIPEEWLQQDLVEGFRWTERSVFPHVERPGGSCP